MFLSIHRTILAILGHTHWKHTSSFVSSTQGCSPRPWKAAFKDGIWDSLSMQLCVKETVRAAGQGLTGIIIVETTNQYLVGGLNPSEKWWTSSVGMMTFPTYEKNKSHVPNHQPDIVLSLITWLCGIKKTTWWPGSSWIYLRGPHRPEANTPCGPWRRTATGAGRGDLIHPRDRMVQFISPNGRNG